MDSLLVWTSQPSPTTQMLERSSQLIQVSLCLGFTNSRDKYLGLPSLVDWNRRKTFCNIQNKIFPMGNLEVLIKVLAQSLPAIYVGLGRRRGLQGNALV